MRFAEDGDKMWGRLQPVAGLQPAYHRLLRASEAGLKLPRRLKPAPHCLSTGEQDMDRVERKPRLGVGLHHARNGVGVLMMPPPDPALNEVLRR